MREKEKTRGQGIKFFHERGGAREAVETVIAALECTSGGFAEIDQELKSMLVGTTTEGPETVAMSKVLLDISTPPSAYLGSFKNRDKAERTPYINRNRPVRPSLGCTVQFGYQVKPSSEIHSGLLQYFKGASESDVWGSAQNASNLDALSAVNTLREKLDKSLDFYYTQEPEQGGGIYFSIPPGNR